MAADPSPSVPGAPRAGRRYSWLLLPLGVCGAVLIALLWRHFKDSAPSADPTFEGGSEDLKQTVIVPTLDTLIPPSKSAIWCSAFQIAWNRLKSDVAKEPIQLENAEAVAERLNRAEQSEADLEPGSFYAAAGLTRDGIGERIRSEMASRFPGVVLPEFPSSKQEAVAYGYLTAALRYQVPYSEHTEGLHFQDSAGQVHKVGAFGIREEDYGHKELRAQFEILYSKQVEFRLDEFAIDLCKSSSPNQVVLARIDRKETLAEMLADLRERITSAAPRGSEPRFWTMDTLAVPNMSWTLRHHFRELEGADKVFLNPSLRGFYLDPAFQEIRFRMDRTRTAVESQARVEVKKGGPREFYCNRPYLIVMKQRGAEQPFFVMWVDNAELLQRHEP